MVIVDTTVWVDYLRGRDTRQAVWLDRNLQAQRLGLTDLILCEVLQGVREDGQLAAVRRQLLKYQVFTTGGVALALAAADNYRYLRSRGYTVRKTIDCLIATFCIENGHILLHSDRDYGPFETELSLFTVSADY